MISKRITYVLYIKNVWVWIPNKFQNSIIPKTSLEIKILKNFILYFQFVFGRRIISCPLILLNHVALYTSISLPYNINSYLFNSPLSVLIHSKITDFENED